LSIEITASIVVASRSDEASGNLVERYHEVRRCSST
jgi:hypothetical protein